MTIYTSVIAYTHAAFCLAIVCMVQSAEVPTPPVYLFTVGNDICSYNASTPNLNSTEDVKHNCFFTYPSSTNHVLGMNLAKNLVYLATNEHIHHVKLTSEAIDQVEQLTFSAGAISDLSADWITGYIYYVDLIINGIRVVTADGSHAYTAVEHIDGLFGIVADPINRYIYWTNPLSSSGSYSIGRSKLDGSSKKDDFITEVGTPYYVTIDHPEQRLYWTSRGSRSGALISAKLDGSDQQTVYEHPGARPYSLTVTQDHIVWLQATSDAGVIYWNDKSSGNYTIHDYVPRLEYVQDIMYYGDYSQPSGHSNACSSNNGGCAQLCFATSDTAVKCVCSMGYQLASDQKSCVPVPHGDLADALIIGDSGLGRLFFMDTTTQVLSAIPTPRHEDYEDVAIDPIKQYIFFSHASDGTIKRTTFNGSTVTNVSSFDDGHSIIGLAVDYQKQLLFYTDTRLGELSSTTYDGLATKMIWKENYTVSIVPDMANEILYVAIASFFNSRIMTIPYDGNTENANVLVDTSIGIPRSLAVDFAEKEMFWGDMGVSKSIQMSDLNGRNRKKIAPLTLTQFPAGISVLGNYIYLIDWRSNNQIVRLNRKDNYEKEDFGTDQFLHTSAIAVAIPIITHSPTPSIQTTPRPRTTATTQGSTQTTLTTVTSTVKTTTNAAGGSAGQQQGNQNGSDSGNINVGVVVGVVLALIVLIVVGVLVAAYFIIKKRRPKPYEDYQGNTAFENPGYANLPADQVTMGADTVAYSNVTPTGVTEKS